MDEQEERLKEVIGEIARLHGVALGKDDPILILETLHARMVSNMTTAIEKEILSFREKLEECLSSYNRQVVRTSENALNAAIQAADKAARERLAIGVESQLSEIRGQVKRDIESPINSAIASIVPHLKSADNMAKLNILSGAMSLLAMTSAIWMIFHTH